MGGRRSTWILTALLTAISTTLALPILSSVATCRSARRVPLGAAEICSYVAGKALHDLELGRESIAVEAVFPFSWNALSIERKAWPAWARGSRGVRKGLRDRGGSMVRRRTLVARRIDRPYEIVIGFSAAHVMIDVARSDYARSQLLKRAVWLAAIDLIADHGGSRFRRWRVPL